MIKQIRRQRSCVIQRLERHSRRERAVADDRHRAAIFAAFGGRDRHAERGADRGARVADAESVVFALAAGRKGREAAVLLDGVQQLAPSGQHLVRIRLMAHVPHQPVMGRIENVMQRDGQLDRAQACGEMPPAGADALDQELPQLFRQRGQLRRPASAAGPQAHGWIRAGDKYWVEGSFRPVYTSRDPGRYQTASPFVAQSPPSRRRRCGDAGPPAIVAGWVTGSFPQDALGNLRHTIAHRCLSR